jgi:hypothetical protein
MPGSARPARRRTGPLALLAALGALGAVCLFLLPACGGSDGNPMGAGGTGGTGGTGGSGGGSGAGPMSATVDGQPWTASANTVVAQTSPTVPGLFQIQGTEFMGSSSKTISVTCYNIAGPGTYPFGVNIMVAGGLGIVATATAGWATPLSGASGTLTITALDPNRIAGTFAFVAGASSGSATTATTVTSGTFDVALPGTALPPLPANAASAFSSTVAGSPWTAATVVSTVAGGNLVVGGSNTQYFVNLIVTGGATPGTYPLGGLVQVIISDPTGGLTGANCCWGGVSGDTGSITVSSVTASRAAGTYSVTLNPRPGSAATVPATVTGSFDVGLF